MTCARSSLTSALLSIAVACAGCGGGASTTAAPAGVATPADGLPGAAAPSTASSATKYTCPTATTSGGALDCTKLPLGDLKYTTTPKIGYIKTCTTPSGVATVSVAPWLNTSAHTWNAVAKVVVSGTHTWPGTFTSARSSTVLSIAGNGLPSASIPTGTYPIGKTDPAYAYDHNPNSIAAVMLAYSLAGNPTAAATPACLGGGPIGVTLTGVRFYDSFDAGGYDAVARELQDGCHGHPDSSSTYHYHGWLQACVPDSGSATQNSTLLGYALDGFGIYGPWYNGKVLRTADLDVCHGTTSPVNWNGKLVSIYHYVSTYDFPYTLSCYKGTPVKA